MHGVAWRYCLIVAGLAGLVPGCERTPAPPPSPSATPAPENAPAVSRPDRLTNSIGMTFARIPAGEFLMGAAEAAPGGRDDERPRHRVRITRPFYLGMYEVTQAEYENVMHDNPSSFTRGGLLKDAPADLDCSRLPVDNVTWYAAIEFCRRLSQRPAEMEAGRVYRLPTEAEWEYACRAGTTTAFHYGDSLASTQANFNGAHPFGEAPAGPFLNRTAVVGSFPPNAFGLYDMHGNLNEWCLDRFDRDYYRHSPADDPPGPARGTARVIRGGDWYSDARDCRSAFRYADIPEGRFYALGMRVVCELISEGAALSPIVARDADPPRAAAVALADSGETPKPAAGEDWPRWRGPRGDGTWRAPPLPTAWPHAGLHRAWRQDLGGGYGGVAVSGGRVYVMDRQRPPETPRPPADCDDREGEGGHSANAVQGQAAAPSTPDVERVLCFDGITGGLNWAIEYPVDYGTMPYDNGPRSTPTIYRGCVYTLGAVGHLQCLDAASGAVIWSHDLVADFRARPPLWGMSASPIVYDGMLIVHAGAEPDGSFIAFDLGNGAERWRTLPDAAGYATPIVVESGGVRQLVAWTPSHVRGIDPSSGRSLWSVPFAVNFGTAIADPIFQEGLVLVSSYYDGSLAIRLGDRPDQAEIAWRDRLNLRGLMSQPLYRAGHAYLLDKRHGLTCFELATGRKLWDDDNRMTPKGRNPQATLVWLGDDDRAIALNSDGDLVLARLGPSGYVEESRANIIGRTWAHPAYAGNCVYARSDSEIVCVVLPAGPTISP